MPERSLVVAYDFCEDLVDACLYDSDEFQRVYDVLEEIRQKPEGGDKFLYSGHAGDHYVVECGRFLIIYQFSATKVWIKTLQLDQDHVR
jgi:hypothetical protein